MMRWACVLVFLVPGMLWAAPSTAAAVDIKSTAAMDLRLEGEFVLGGPKTPLRYRLEGPGRAAIVVVPAPVPGLERVPVTVEVLSASIVMKKETVLVEAFPRLEAKRGSASFTPFGFRRITFLVPPKSALFEVRVSVPAAVSVLHPKTSKPVPPDGASLEMFSIGGTSPWYWASVCDGIRIKAPQKGVLKLDARMQLQSITEQPPPISMRVLSGGKVRGALPLNLAPDHGLEFGKGRIRYAVSMVKTLKVNVPEEGEYTVELAAWGCVSGVGVEIVFEPGVQLSGEVAAADTKPREETVSPGESSEAVPPDPALESMSGIASAIGQRAPAAAAVGTEMIAQCNLLMEDVTRQRVFEYLDTMLAAGLIPGARVSVTQDQRLNQSFRVESIVYMLDDYELMRKENPPRGVSLLAEKEIVPGPHTLEVRALLRGRGGGEFSHLNDYILRVYKKESFMAESGRRYEIKAAFRDRGGLMTALKDRPYIEVGVVPVEEPIP